MLRLLLKVNRKRRKASLQLADLSWARKLHGARESQRQEELLWLVSTFWFQGPSLCEAGKYFPPMALVWFSSILSIIFDNPFNNEQVSVDVCPRFSFLIYTISHLEGPADIKILCRHNALILDPIAMCLQGSIRIPSVITPVPGKKQRLKGGKLRPEKNEHVVRNEHILTSSPGS